MLTVDALDKLSREPDVSSECRYKTSPLQAGLVPDVQFGSVFVGAQENGAATEAHLALGEFCNTLNDVSPRVVDPSMVISEICTRVAQQPIATASSLWERFGSVSKLSFETFDELKSCTNMDDEALLFTRATRELMVLALYESIQHRPILSNNEVLHSYLKFTTAHDCVGSVELLFLMSNNAMIREKVRSVGIADGIEVHPRKIVGRTLEIGAAALIIAYDHPSGDTTLSSRDDTTLSSRDIEMTRLPHSTLRLLGLSLHDHVIAGASCCYSMREAGLI